MYYQISLELSQIILRLNISKGRWNEKEEKWEKNYFCCTSFIHVFIHWFTRNEIRHLTRFCAKIIQKLKEWDLLFGGSWCCERKRKTKKNEKILHCMMRTCESSWWLVIKAHNAKSGQFTAHLFKWMVS